MSPSAAHIRTFISRLIRRHDASPYLQKYNKDVSYLSIFESVWVACLPKDWRECLARSGSTGAGNGGGAGGGGVGVYEPQNDKGINLITT